jgi:hypothetical protein
MQSVVGIVDSQERARRVSEDVITLVPRARVRILTPETSAGDLAALPTDDAEQPGMGGAIGAATGGATAASAATMVLPPVGAIAVVGLAVAGLVGVLAGMAVGHAIEESGTFGLPRDELFFYVHALCAGRFVVVVTVENDGEAERVRGAFATAGVQSVDAAREAWWVGLRDAEVVAYGDGARFAEDEAAYRRGFEAACRGRRVDDIGVAPAERAAAEAGWTRGRQYAEATRRRFTPEPPPERRRA